MRVQTVLIWVVVAGLLAGVVALTRSGGPAAGAAEGGSTWTIPLDPTRVVRLERQSDGRTVDAAERTGADAWTLRWTDTGGGAGPRTWPADPGRVRAALRLLSTAEIIPAADESDMAPETTVVVTEGDGRSVEIWFGGRAAGGQTPVVVLVKGPDGVAERRVDGRIGSAVPDAFMRTDWTTWRDPTLFDASAATVSAMSIQTNQHRVRVERGPRGWSITEPFSFGADPSEVERAIGVLRAMTAASFEDRPPGDDVTGVDRPVASVRVETPEGMRLLEVGRATDSTGKILFGRITVGDTVSTIRLDAEALSRVTAVPDVYVRRSVLSVSPRDIGRVRFVGPSGRLHLDAARAGDGWAMGDETTSPGQRDAIDRLIRVLTAEPAAAVAYRPVDAGDKGELGTIEVQTREGVPIGVVRLRTEQGPQGMYLLMAMNRGDDGELVWTGVSETAKGVVAWAAAMATGG